MTHRFRSIHAKKGMREEGKKRKGATIEGRKTSKWIVQRVWPISNKDMSGFSSRELPKIIVAPLTKEKTLRFVVVDLCSEDGTKPRRVLQVLVVVCRELFPSSFSIS